jgi:hypothetical protein
VRGWSAAAIAIASATLMILELEEGFGAVVHISPQPMRQAVKDLEAQQAVTKFGANGSWAPGL